VLPTQIGATTTMAGQLTYVLTVKLLLSVSLGFIPLGTPLHHLATEGTTSAPWRRRSSRRSTSASLVSSPTTNS
jgi:hypothetical protein